MTSTGNFFFGTPFPNFSVNNDRVLDNLRVRQPNTFKCPPAPKDLINPNVDDAKGNPLSGDNNPATNATLRSGCAQAGALVYCTTPIVNSNGGGKANDGCFDGRNHLYFSDGDQWIPLSNCLPQGADCAGPQYAEYYIHGDDHVDTQCRFEEWFQVRGDREKGGVSAQGFKVETGHVDEKEHFGPSFIEYTGSCDIDAHVSVSVSWHSEYNYSKYFDIAVFKNELEQHNLHQEGVLAGPPNANDPLYALNPRNVSIDGFVKLTQGDKLRVLIRNRGTAPSGGGSTPWDTFMDAWIHKMNLNVVKLGNSVPE